MRRRRRLGAWLVALLVAVPLLAWLASIAGVLLWARRDHALALWRRGLAPRLILTGGTGVGDTTSEAAVGRRYVLRRGVPEQAVITENRGKTTRESMRA